ncbi:MAG: hypothetical protein SVY53_05945 [Chloroflexota bacterium]|nr:hypothetical protein [Chloroflexota bacterium]
MTVITPEELTHRIWYAQWFLDGLYKESENYAFGAEYPTPGILVERPGEQDHQRLAGFWSSGICQDTDIDDVDFGQDWDEQIFEFHCVAYPPTAAPKIKLKREYQSDGRIKYTLTVQSNRDSRDIDIYCGNYKVGSIDGDTSLPISWSWYGTAWRGYPSNRYTLRHSTWFLSWLYQIIGKSDKADKLDSTLDAYGYEKDIYMPLFGLGTNLADDYLFTDGCYKDCDYDGDRAGDNHPYGLDAGGEEGSRGGYAYESKVAKFSLSGWTPGRSAYIWVSKRDRLARMLQAVHILNKYDDPDHTYTDPKGGTTTPRSIAREMECDDTGEGPWTGIGINAYGTSFPYLSDENDWQVNSGVRTNVFALLETLLGYKYYDATSRGFADAAIESLVQVQWGVARPHNVDGYGIDDDDGTLFRPQFTGACLGNWIAGSMKFIHKESLWDIANMGSEDKTIAPTNGEASGTFFQAMRTYLHYRYHKDCPTSSYIP